MKRLLALTLILSLFLGTISYGGEIVSETPEYFSRTKDYVSVSFGYNAPASGNVYYGFSESQQSISSPSQLQSIVTTPSSYPEYVLTGNSEVVTGGAIEIYIEKPDLSPDKIYYIYATYIAPGVSDNLYNLELPVYNYIKNVTYNNGDINDKTDDKLIIDFADPYTINESTSSILQLGIDEMQHYGIISLSQGSDYTLSTVDSDTISLNFTSDALAKFDDETDWSATASRKCFISLYDESDFSHGNGMFDFTFSFDMLTYIAPPKLQSLEYENNKDFLDDKFILTFDSNLVTDVTVDNLLFTFDDKANSSYADSDYALSSESITILQASKDSNKIIVGLNSSAETILKQLEYSTIAKVQIVNPTSGNKIVDPNYATSTTNMPGQNPKLKSISINGTPISGFNSNYKDYVKTVMYDDFDLISSNPSRYITYETLDSGASVTVTSSATEIAIYSTIRTTSKDTLQSDTYAVDIFKADNRLSNIMINGQSISGFSPETTSYNFTVNETYVIPNVQYTSNNQEAHVYISFTGSLPGTYTYTIRVEDNGISKSYVLTFQTEYSNSNNDSSNNNDTTSDNGTTTTTTEPQTTTEKIEQEIKTTSNSIETIVNSTIADVKAVDIALSKIDDSISKSTTDKDLVATTTSLTTLTKNLSKTAVSTSGTNQKATETVNKVSEYIEKIIVKINDSKEKVTQIENFTKSIKEIKDSDLDSVKIDKVVNDIVKDASKTLSKVYVQPKKEVGPLPKYVIDSNQINTSLINVQTTTDQLNKLVNDYFGEDNYIQLKKEVQLELDVTKEEKSFQIVIDKNTVDTLQNNKVQKLNIKIEESELSLDAESLTSGDDYEFLLQRKEINKEQTNIDPAISEGLTNNSKYMEVDLFKNGEKVGNLKKPAKLSFDVQYFGYDVAENGDELSVYRYDDTIKTWEPVGGIYDPQSGTITVNRIHLSKYTVMKTKKTITGVDNTEVKDDVQALLNKGVIRGEVGDMKANITREEFIAWLGQSYGLTSSSSATPFEDLDPNSESYKFVASVYEQGIISGKSAKSFGADDYMTYEEVAVVLSNTLTKLDNKKLNNNLTAKLDKLGAEIDISDWAKDQVALVIELGYFDKSVALNTKGYISREQAAEIFNKFYS